MIAYRKPVKCSLSVLAIGLIGLLLGACSGQVSTPHDNSEDKAEYLTLLHTNDHHGRFWNNKYGEYGMAARKTLIDRLRNDAESRGHAVLLLSGGDINTGVPESDLQLAEPDFRGMRAIGYDAMALGNHEFDNPLSVLEQQKKWAGFPLLSANIFWRDSGELAYQPYALLEKGGLKIAVIGLTTQDTSKIGNPEYVAPLNFADPVTSTNAVLPEIEAQHQPDMVLAVTHMGHYLDARFTVNSPGDVTLARGLPTGSLTAVIGGHSQEPVCMEGENRYDEDFKPGDECQPDRQNGIWIMQAHEWGKYVGHAEFRKVGEQWELQNYRLHPVNLYRDKERTQWAAPYIEHNRDIVELLTPFQRKGTQQLDVGIGNLDEDLDGSRSLVRFRQAPIAQLILAAQMEATTADVGIISGGGIRDSIDAGEVSYKDILQVHPFKNRIGYVDFSAAELEDYLNTVIQFPPDTGAYLQYRGVSFTLDGQTMRDIRVAGQALDPNRSYRVSLNSFNAAGGDGYPKLKDHPRFVDTSRTDAEVLVDFFKRHNPVVVKDL